MYIIIKRTFCQASCISPVFLLAYDKQLMTEAISGNSDRKGDWNELGWFRKAHDFFIIAKESQEKNPKAVEAIEAALPEILAAAKSRKGKPLLPKEIPEYLKALKIVIAGGPIEETKS